MPEFRYSTRPERQLEFQIRRPEHLPNEENLTGRVGGKPASDIEERIARALTKFRKRFSFQVPFPTMHSLPGQAKQVDFVIDDQPLDVYGYIGHFFSSGQRAKDIVRENLLNEVFRYLGLRPLKTVPYHELQTQEEANAWVRRNIV